MNSGLLERVRLLADEAGAATAVVDATTSLTWKQLWEEAHLAARGISARGGLVVLEMPGGVGRVVALLATWLAEACAAPLDPSAPWTVRRPVREHPSTRLVVTDWAPGRGLQGHERAWPGAAPACAGAAYVCFTSGSTGHPKGVLIGHPELAAHCRAAAEVYDVRHDDVCYQFAAFGFDTAMEEIGVALTTGCTLAMGTGPRTDPDEVANDVIRRGVTIIQLPTAYWRCLPAAGRIWEGVRLTVVGGEAVHPRDVARHHTGPLRNSILVNTYGPTEAVITATSAHVDGSSQHDDVPIGDPLPGRTHALADGSQLLLGGRQLAWGYLGDARRTADSFRPDPSTRGGRVYRTGDVVRPGSRGMVFVGRVDRQVKVRGQRVDLDDVERALRTLPGVEDACAVAVDLGSTGPALAAAVVTRLGWGPAEVRGASPLPLSRLVVVEALPLGPSGKVDRAAVQVMVELPPPAPIVSGAPESALISGLRSALDDDAIDLDSDFLAHGGDSVLAMAIAEQVTRAGLALRPSDLLRSRSLRAAVARARERALDPAGG